ncbi:ImmA/IrrE family metallo-endopeptidase [Mangrovibacillus cuniculi]|uniref:ImmA/IrrE family metallo-endopeptidase n=1 Tax=Mangrovibacillus cuniculi TaxID=2593652 RepID=A0A7S8CBW8_9BACI|nr:ImmA/IrrE family metallo-endopeptidase [Mangrovibacillus cuniculi]QPC47144.1 ImmA/IrrE family metallo-endopeptidase [Mangrovibacillus cuniculi]QPC48505.1 ImmA/IrrE family metallo-endopeptidase [Mangrovibacillus cuniculi]
MEHIERKVQSLIKKHDTNNPLLMAKSLGIQVVFEPLGKTLGYYSKHFRIKVIHINEQLDQEQQSFVCAHELGHAVCHPDSNTPFMKKNTLFSTDRIEQEANAFALSLLFFENDLSSPLTLELAMNKYGIPQKLLRSSHIFF